MGSTFGTYNTAYSGMYTSQAALASTSSNLSNVNTTGASRVRNATTDSTTIQSGDLTTGTGSTVDSITRARDTLLDKTYRTQNADSAYLAVKSGNHEYIDEMLAEFETGSDSTTGSDGVLQSIEDFFSSWSDLATDPSSESARTAVVSAGVDLVDTLTGIDEELQQLQADAVTGVKDGIDSLNDLASQIADLNGQIKTSELDGSEASYLRDQRDALLDEMSALANITTTETNGTLQISIGGITVVNGTTTHTLSVSGTGETDDPLVVSCQDYACDVNITSGSIGAYLEDADQSGYSAIDTTSLPYDFTADSNYSISSMRQAINDLLTTLATKINSLQTSGTDLNGDAGIAFFTAIDSSQPLSSTNIQVNPLLTADSDLLSAGTSGESGDNTLANEIAELIDDTSCYSYDGQAQDITGFYSALTTWLGTTGDTYATQYETQAALVTQIDTQRQAVSSISTDEEMSNMIQFQNAYAASARVMSTIDGLIGNLIEDLG